MNLLLSDGRRLSWTEIEGDGPPIVLIPGAGETALTWAPIVNSLGHTIAYDRAGFGTSDPVTSLTIESQVTDLAALLAEVGPAVLVGHSWGGLLAQLVAWERPSLVLGLVLVDPTHEEVIASLSARDRMLARAMCHALPLLKALGVFHRVGRRLAARCTDDLALRQSIVDAYVAAYPDVRLIAAENRLTDNCVAYVRPRRQQSSAVVLCATQRKVDLMGGMPVPDTGHYIHHDQPDVVISAIREVASGAANSSRRAPSS